MGEDQFFAPPSNLPLVGTLLDPRSPIVRGGLSRSPKPRSTGNNGAAAELGLEAGKNVLLIYCNLMVSKDIYSYRSGVEGGFRVHLDG